MKHNPANEESGYDAARRSERAAEAALDWALTRGESERIMRAVPAEVRRVARRRAGAAVAGIAAIALAALIWSGRFATPATITPISEAAKLPPTASIIAPAKRILPDGSGVELKQDARIAVDFTADARRVTLEQGEAHFTVRADPARPFIVQARGVETRAVGTAFAVELGAASVEVLVTEGKVETRVVESPAAAVEAPAPTLLAAGHRVVIDLTPASPVVSPIEHLTGAEVDARLSWRIPRIEFAGTRLVDVARLFHHHSGIRIVLVDPALEQLQLSGVLRADNTDSLLRLLELEFGIRAERRSEAEIVLRP